MSKRIPIPPLDLMFFITESAQSPKHVGAVQIFEMPENAPDDYLQKLVARLKEAPVIAPFSYTPHFPKLGMPEWRDSEDIEIDYHVRHSALPKPGSNDQLMEVVERLHSTLLDRSRPCWVCQVIEGLEGNRFAIYSKIHHALIDGMSGVKRMYGSLSTSPSNKKIVASWSFDPSKDKAKKKTSDRPRKNPLIEQASGVLEASNFLRKMSMQWLKLKEGDMQVPFSAKRTRMNRPIKWDSRSTAICSLPLDRIKQIGKARDCTVNEVVLAIIGASLDEYLSSHGETPKSPLVALCPMSVRSQTDDSARTQVSAVHVKLGDPGVNLSRRLRQVVDSSNASKAEVSTLSGTAMMDYGIMIFALWELLERSKLDQFVAPSYNVLVSNVPGPGDEAMYLNGSRMVASYPISTLLPGVNLNVTLLSHGSTLDFGLLGDRHALPDLGQVSDALVEQFDLMEKEILGKKPRTRRKTAVKKVQPKRKTRTRKAAGK